MVCWYVAYVFIARCKTGRSWSAAPYMESANYLISIFRLISRGLAPGVGWAREGRGVGLDSVGQCWTVLDSVGHLLPTSCAHPGFRGSGRDQRLAVSHSSGLERPSPGCFICQYLRCPPRPVCRPLVSCHNNKNATQEEWRKEKVPAIASKIALHITFWWILL